MGIQPLPCGHGSLTTLSSLRVRYNNLRYENLTSALAVLTY